MCPTLSGTLTLCQQPTSWAEPAAAADGGKKKKKKKGGTGGGEDGGSESAPSTQVAAAGAGCASAPGRRSSQLLPAACTAALPPLRPPYQPSDWLPAQGRDSKQPHLPPANFRPSLSLSLSLCLSHAHTHRTTPILASRPRQPTSRSWTPKRRLVRPPSWRRRPPRRPRRRPRPRRVHAAAACPAPDWGRAMVPAVAGQGGPAQVNAKVSHGCRLGAGIACVLPGTGFACRCDAGYPACLLSSRAVHAVPQQAQQRRPPAPRALAAACQEQHWPGSGLCPAGSG